ncbi:MAG: LysE family transporter [Gorillibacterium sp.]|nr:LysE family transporter [Gorillibacterium sp.]
MSTLSVVFTGIGFGLSIAAPVGPVGLLCMNRTLSHGFRHGFVSGLGVAVADACYGLLTVAGLHLISDRLFDYSIPLRIIGGLFLAYLGIAGLLKNAKKADSLRGKGAHSLFRSFLSTYALTLTNPMTILSFLALAASIGATVFIDSILLTMGIFLGSIAWWFILSFSIHIARKALPAFMIKHLNTLSSLIILGFGLIIIGTALAMAGG